MAHIAVVTLPLAGHLDPMGALVEALQARGHRVTVVGPPGVCELALAKMERIRTFALSTPTYPGHRLDDFLGRLPDVRGLRGIRGVIAEIAALSELYAQALPDALARLAPDALVYDQLEPAAGIVARGLGLPHASVACALPMNREAHLPPPYLGWPLRDHALWRSLYGGGYLVVDRLMRPQAQVLEAACRRFDLPPLPDVSACVSQACDLSQCAPGFDYPRKGGPEALGPLRRRRPLLPLGFERDGRELVFVSFGTLMGHRLELLERVARACATHVVQCVIAHGGRLGPEEEAKLRALPGQPVVRDYVDHRSVLNEARAAVLHGGLNSVLDALGHGVPMVVLPLAFEQAAIAARVRRAGAGRIVRRPTVRRLEAALDAVLNNRSLRAKALGLARSNARAGGADAAAARIEAQLPVPVSVPVPVPVSASVQRRVPEAITQPASARAGPPGLRRSARR